MSSRHNFFNQVAETWDENVITKRLLDFLEQVVPTFGLKDGDKILDLGTGTGVLIPFLLRAIGYSGSIVAVDFSEKMIEKARTKFIQYPNVTFLVQKVEDLAFSSESFDVVTCFGLFPHLEDKQKALVNINKALKSGGRLIIAHALSSQEIASHHHNASIAVAHDNLPKEIEMKKLLSAAGFVGVRIIDKSGCYLCFSNKP